jgi:serine/threonine protein kinase
MSQIVFKDYKLDSNAFKDIKPLDESSQGSEGDMFEAIYMGNPVVLKQFKLDGHFMEGVQEIVTIHVKFNDNSFVKFLGWIGHNEKTSFVFEKMQTDLLHLVTSDKNPTETKKVEIAMSIAKAIQKMNNENFVHRDLKPENILVSLFENKKDYRVALCDFSFTTEKTNSITMNTTTGRKNTINYASPEVLRAQYGVPSDVYSFGMVVLFLFTGQVPYSDIERSALEDHIQTGNLPTRELAMLKSPIQTLVKEHIIDPCIASNYKKRPKFQEIYENLQMLLE